MFSNKIKDNQKIVRWMITDEFTENMIQEWCICWNQTCQSSNEMNQDTISYLKYEYIDNFYQNFCQWDMLGVIQILSTHKNNNGSENEINQAVPFNLALESSHELVKTRRINNLPEIDKNLLKILQLSSEISFEHWIKSARGLHNGVSQRRSVFIGVLKNKNRWQVLINNGRHKHYIGTYLSEIEAAIVHDFYSIGINFLKAKTNFFYTKELLVPMIISYFSSGKVFNPSKFISQVINYWIQNVSE